MNLNIKAILLTAVCGLFFFVACNKKQEQTQAAQPAQPEAVHTFSVNGSVREMNITLENPDFPEHPGRSEFMSYCAMCHSLKYITMQPSFPRKVWEAEVSKMVVKYKAPIDSVTCNKITDYLVSIKSGQPQ